MGTSPTEVPTGEWLPNPQTPTDEYPYLWNKELITYTDSTSPEETEPAIIGVKGDKGTTPEIRDGYWYIGDEQIGQATGNDGDTPYIGENGNWWIGGEDKGRPATGNGVKEVKEWYLATETQATPDNDTSKWTLGKIPDDFGQDKPYLWNYEEITGTDGKIMSSVTVLIGVWGKDGKEITSVENYYAISASKDTVPALSEFVTRFVAPTLEKPYLWNYEKVYYSEGDPSTTEPAIIGIMGATIVSITELYYLSSTSDAPDAPTTEVTEKRKVLDQWTQTCPDFANGYTYFTCSQILRSDGVFTWSEVVSAGDIKNHTYYTEEGKHPLPPYNVGDIWVCSHYVDTGAVASISQIESENIVTDTDADGNVVVLVDANYIEYKNEILVCINGKKSGETFSINDWQPAADYAHDSDYAYLRDALPETSSVVNGGLVLGSFIGVSDAEEGSVTDGNVVAGLCGVRGGDNEFYDTDKNSKLLLFAGADPNDTPATKYKNAKTQIWDDGTLITTIGKIEGLTIKSTRSPFVPLDDEKTTYDIGRNDNGIGSGTVDFPHGVENSGRRIVLAGNFGAVSSAASPFYVDGRAVTSVEAVNEVVEFLGLGTDDEFKGWAVLARSPYLGGYKEGQVMRTLAAGKVVGTSASAKLDSYICAVANDSLSDYSSDNQIVSVTRTGTGVYKMVLPGWWFEDSARIFVNLTGFGAVYGGKRPVKATLYSISGSTSEGWTLEIRTSDDETENDGSFYYEIKTLSGWLQRRTKV